jgi:hypothetical protein
MFSNAQKLILCATNSSMTVGLWHGTKLHTFRVFKNQDHDHTEFSKYLAQYNNINVYLIADAIEEDYKLESLPHTTGSARREIVEPARIALHISLIVLQINVKMTISYLLH